MRNNQSYFLSAILLAGLLVTGCNLPTAQTTATPDANMIITEAALSAAAELTRSAEANPLPTATRPLLATDTPEPTAGSVEQPAALPEVTNTVKPAVGQETSGDAASFVADVTIPDGTAAAPGVVFDKTWRIKNTGTTTWTPAYSLTVIEGEKMGSPEKILVPKEVRPGEEVEITVSLTAPTQPGSYQTFFRLRNAEGQFFRLDGGGDLWIKIIVGLAATNTPISETLTPTP